MLGVKILRWYYLSSYSEAENDKMPEACFNIFGGRGQAYQGRGTNRPRLQAVRDLFGGLMGNKSTSSCIEGVPGVRRSHYPAIHQSAHRLGSQEILRVGRLMIMLLLMHI